MTRVVRIAIVALALALAGVLLFWHPKPLLARRDPFVSKDPAALKVLFIGNSHTFVNELPVVFGKLVAAGQPSRPLAISDVVMGGVTLGFHLTNGGAAHAIAHAPWDYVVLQEQSYTTLTDVAAFEASVRTFDAMIRRAGGKTVLYEVWPDIGQDDRVLHETYVRVANAVGAILVPAGPAWVRAIAADDKLVLYQPDGHHAAQAGTYLTGCVFYHTLLGVSPVGLPSLGMVSDATATELQRVASL